ncbi:uncharacterized protein EAF01_003356 [Botrytis porri]|uniref:uncharacterized protein n=1 Tax=Botrytis porri TaxID=87229 RepID=UPI0019022DCC|nr:uncharacterized protein EAF01_003356 [Botrytis porri]KAF7909638.1 hypothetical protein EAF01_003356 [Botrytis porri]
MSLPADRPTQKKIPTLPREKSARWIGIIIGIIEEPSDIVLQPSSLGLRLRNRVTVDKAAQAGPFIIPIHEPI